MSDGCHWECLAVGAIIGFLVQGLVRSVVRAVFAWWHR